MNTKHETLMTLFDEEGNTVFEDAVIGSNDLDTTFDDDEEALVVNEVETFHLPLNSVFVSKYTIKKVLGQGALGIAYLAEESSSKNQVVVKEFFPKKMVRRVTESEVSLQDNTTEQDENNYVRLKEVFLEEAQNLSLVNKIQQHTNVVGFSFLEENVNNTIYYAMPYSEGEELLTYLEKKKEEGIKLSQDEIMEIVVPILNGLSHIHKYGIFHKDIKPANIFMRKHDGPMLIDFGGSVTSANLLTRAYAAIEQVNKQLDSYGDYTDLYAMGVMMYEMVTGTLPPKSSDRAAAINGGKSDPYVPLLGNKGIRGRKFEAHFLKAIDHALKLSYQERPQTATVLKKELTGDLKRKKRNKILLISLLSIIFLSAVGGFIDDKTRSKIGSFTLLEKGEIEVYIDGQPREADEKSKNGYPIYKLDEGKHTFELKKSNFLTLQKTYTVDVLEDKMVKKDVQFIPEKVEILIKVEDSKGDETFKADLFVDGKNRGLIQSKKVSFDFNRLKGLSQKFKFEVKAEGYHDAPIESMSYRELIKKDEMTLKLVKKEGSIKFETPTGFYVKIDDKLQRDSNGEKHRIPCIISHISEGNHSIILSSTERVRLDETSSRKMLKYESISLYKMIKDKTEIVVSKSKKVRKEFIEAQQKVEEKKIEEEKKKKEKEKKEKAKREQKSQRSNPLQVKEVLSKVKFPDISVVNGISVATNEVTNDEIVRYLNSTQLSIEKLKTYFYLNGSRVSRYITRELSEKGEYHYYVNEKYKKYPISYVSWIGAKAYTKWLSQQGRGSYRLLSSDEWRSVASLGFSEKSIDSHSHNKENSTSSVNPVKTKELSSSAVYDLFGNVAEWCEDKSGEFSRIVRGGSYKTSKHYMNLDEFLIMNERSVKNSDIGFRVTKSK